MKYIRFCIVLFIIVFLSTGVSALEYPKINAGAALLYDTESGETLLSQNADQKAYPASLTKIMTALLVIEKDNLNDVVTVTSSSLTGLSESGSSVALKIGEQVTVHDLLYMLLIPSGNDAASVLAEHTSGTIDAFVNSMNERASALGCTGTHFANPHGLHDENHYTTAHDLLLITNEAMKHDIFKEIVATQKYEVPATNKTATKRTLLTTNYLISRLKDPNYIYSGAKGIKTGSTTPAGHCLITYAEKNGFNLISVVLGATQDPVTKRIGSFDETIKLLNWGAGSFTYKTLITNTEAIKEVPVRLANDKNYVVLSPSGSIEHLVPIDLDLKKVEKKVDVNDDIVAPIKKGQRLGTITVSYEGHSYGTLDLVATNDVERSDVLYYIDRIENILKSKIFKIIVFGVVLVALFLIIYIIFVNRSKHKKRRQYKRIVSRRSKSRRR